MNVDSSSLALAYIFYGISFLIMGVTILNQASELKHIKGLGFLVYFGLFGLIYSISQFLEFGSVFYQSTNIVYGILAFIQIVAFGIFLVFGGTAVEEAGSPKWVYCIVPIVCIVVWIVMVIKAVNWDGSVLFIAANLARYCLLVPSGIMAGSSVLLLSRSEKISQIHGINSYLKIFGICIFIYTIFEGILEPFSNILVPRTIIAVIMSIVSHFILNILNENRIHERQTFVKLHIQAEENIKRMTLLNRLNQLSCNMLSVSGIEQVGDIVLKDVREATGAIRGRVVLWSECFNQFILKNEYQEKDAVDIILHDETSLLLKIYEEKEDAEALFKYAQKYGYSQMCCQPLDRDNKLEGAIFLYFADAKLLGESLKHYLNSVSAMAVLAFDRENLHKSLQLQIDLDTQLHIYNFSFLLKKLKEMKLSNIEHGLLLVDIENFKAYNSAYGYVRGDELLSVLAAYIGSIVNHSDEYLCRYTGDKFCMLLKHSDQERVDYIISKLNEFVDLDSFYNPAHVNVEINSDIVWYNSTTQDLLKSALEKLDKFKEEKRRLHEERIKQFEKFAVIGQLSAGLAHEIRNPLTAIKGFIQLLNNDKDNKVSQEILDILHNEVHRIDRLIREFLLLAKPSAPEKEPISIKALLDEIVIIMSVEAGLKAIGIVKEYESKEPIDVVVDKEQIKQVLINLVKNGLEAMQQRGKLYLDYYIQDNDQLLILSIKDEGMGIAESNLNRIFEPFYTLKESGTGLGLAVSLSIVHSHGGHIYVNSKEGEGSEFKVEIPYNHIKS